MTTKESFIPLHVPEKPIITHLLNQLTAWIKSLFSLNTSRPTAICGNSGLFAKVAVVGAGVLAIGCLAYWFWRRKTQEVEELIKEGQQLLMENKKLWRENQMISEENQHVRERVDALEHNVWEMMELILNMKNPKNKDTQEKIERQLNILKQCFENRLNELRTENKILRERAKELYDERICSICLENKLDRCIVPCGHPICHNCEIPVSERNTCPFCRTRIESIIPRY
jgi:hypothetical protein